MSVVDIIFYSPLSGPVIPLEEVPDPVFAQRMAGDGLAIDPLDCRALSPCSAKVVQVHRHQHVVGLATDEGAKILIHVGIETVKLNGEGFRVRVSNGQRVSKGDLLIEFDADLIARKAKSLITVFLITNSDRFHPTNPFQGVAKAGTTPLFLIQTKVRKAAVFSEVWEVTKKALRAPARPGRGSRRALGEGVPALCRNPAPAARATRCPQRDSAGVF
jgi:glucose-specific phosphotransferase system IIA component